MCFGNRRSLDPTQIVTLRLATVVSGRVGFTCPGGSHEKRGSRREIGGSLLL